MMWGLDDGEVFLLLIVMILSSAGIACHGVARREARHTFCYVVMKQGAWHSEVRRRSRLWSSCRSVMLWSDSSSPVTIERLSFFAIDNVYHHPLMLNIVMKR